MIERVKTFVKNRHLIDFKRPLAVGVSGGADSVALLHLLHSWQIPVIALHCNFHLRGDESDRDTLFVESLCKSWGISFETIHFETVDYAHKRGISIEMAARELRYEWFENRRIAWSAQAIAVAHHQDDRKETILLNLLRGTGIRGLVALHPRQGNIIRPFLCVKQSEILQYCKDHSLEYVDDSTNFESICQRNRVRLELLPLMESITHGAGDRLLRMADQLAFPLYTMEQEIENFLKAHAEVTPRYLKIPLSAITAHSHPFDLLFELLHPLSFNRSDLDDILGSFSKKETKQFYSSTHRVIKEREMLYIAERMEIDKNNYFIFDTFDSYDLPVALKFESSIRDSRQTLFSIDRNEVLLDYDRLLFPLQLRRLQEGDRFAPINMNGKKLVSDYLKDTKIPLLDRENIWILTSGNEIVWVAGCRADDRFKVTEATSRLLKITLLDG